MSKYLWRVLGLAMASISCVEAAPDLSDFTLVFEEEFTEPELDPKVWNTGYLWGPYANINNEEQMYVDTLGINASSLKENGGETQNPFELTGSSLKITASLVKSSAFSSALYRFN